MAEQWRNHLQYMDMVVNYDGKDLFCDVSRPKKRIGREDQRSKNWSKKKEKRSPPGRAVNEYGLKLKRQIIINMN